MNLSMKTVRLALPMPLAATACNGLPDRGATHHAARGDHATPQPHAAAGVRACLPLPAGGREDGDPQGI
jgi:hypothetical protein